MHAGAYSSWAKVDYIERVGNGIVINGAFGDPMSCGTSNIIYYPKTHADSDLVSSMALTALAADKEMKFYVDSCVSVSFHWGSSPVINQSINGQAIYIR